MANPDLSHIVEPLRLLAIPVGDLVRDPHNARMHDDRNLTTIERSLRRWGQRTPLVVNKNGMVVEKGNGTLEVGMDRLGWTHIAAVVLDDTSEEAIQYAIADNRSGELANWNWPVLTEQLDEISMDDPQFDFADLGWADEIDNLLQADWEPPVRGADNGDTDPDEVGKRHHVALNQSNNEIFQRAFEVMKEDGAIPDNGAEGFAIATLADFWMSRRAQK